MLAMTAEERHCESAVADTAVSASVAYEINKFLRREMVSYRAELFDGFGSFEDVDNGSLTVTGFMPRKPRFVSGVKRHVSDKNNKLREAPPFRQGASLVR